MKGHTGPQPQHQIAARQEQSGQIQNKSEKSMMKWPDLSKKIWNKSEKFILNLRIQRDFTMLQTNAAIFQ